MKTVNAQQSVEVCRFSSAEELGKLFELPTVENWRQFNLLECKKDGDALVLTSSNPVVKKNLKKLIKWYKIEASVASRAIH